MRTESSNCQAFPPSSCMDLFGGIRVLESSHCQERVWWRKPRTKKRRIRRKWELREENNRYEPRAYKIDANTVMVHTSIAKRLREEMPPNAESSDLREQPKP